MAEADSSSQRIPAEAQRVQLRAPLRLVLHAVLVAADVAHPVPELHPPRLLEPRRLRQHHQRDRNAEDLRYRRRMKLTVGPKRLDWQADVPSDDDGYVKQQSFTVSPKLALDAQGHLTDLPFDGCQKLRH